MSRDLTLLHPALQEKWKELQKLCSSQGLVIKNTSTVRTAAEQAECVAKGTSSVSYPHSHHNWGTAVDFCRNDGTGAYNTEGRFFERVGAIAESIGLIWGGSFSKPDRPHLQLADWGKTADLLIDLYGTPEAFKNTWYTDREDTPPAPQGPQNPQESKDPAETGFAIGDKVIVTGTIYGTGKGTGGAIAKNSAEMYIVDYAGANYPYCWGVAKTASGIRQGWAAPEVLQAADGDAETEYVKWPAVCNEPMTNVRTGAGVQNSIMTAWPLLGVGNQVDVIGQGMAPNGVLWYKILIANQYEGWVCGAFLDPA